MARPPRPCQCCGAGCGRVLVQQHCDVPEEMTEVPCIGLISHAARSPLADSDSQLRSSASNVCYPHSLQDVACKQQQQEQQSEQDQQQWRQQQQRRQEQQQQEQQ